MALGTGLDACSRCCCGRAGGCCWSYSCCVLLSLIGFLGLCEIDRQAPLLNMAPKTDGADLMKSLYGKAYLGRRQLACKSDRYHATMAVASHACMFDDLTRRGRQGRPGLLTRKGPVDFKGQLHGHASKHNLAQTYFLRQTKQAAQVGDVMGRAQPGDIRCLLASSHEVEQSQPHMRRERTPDESITCLPLVTRTMAWALAMVCRRAIESNTPTCVSQRMAAVDHAVLPTGAE